VVPASFGGAWIDPNTCDECNRSANVVADQLIANDPLVSFLRAAYRVPDRYGKKPAAGKFSVRIPQGGVVKVTLTDGGPRFEAGISASVMKA
jgi:hypothetical protein